MTPSENTVPLPFKLCRNGLHFYSRDLKGCPECKRESSRRNWKKNGDRWLTNYRAKVTSTPEAHAAYRKRIKEWHEAHREESKKKRADRYWEDPEKRRQESRNYCSQHPERGVWRMMIRRCCHPSANRYLDYGGRGIRVCHRWMGTDGYANFLLDMGKRPSPGHQLDRINNDGDYEPSNCRWATRKEQARNRRNNYLITIDGQTRCLLEWSDISGLKYGLIRDRIEVLGWDEKRAVFTPARVIRRPN